MCHARRGTHRVGVRVVALAQVLGSVDAARARVRQVHKRHLCVRRKAPEGSRVNRIMTLTLPITRMQPAGTVEEWLSSVKTGQGKGCCLDCNLPPRWGCGPVVQVVGATDIVGAAQQAAHDVRAVPVIVHAIHLSCGTLTA